MDKKTAGKKKQYKPKVLAFTCLWCGVGKNEVNPVEVFSDFKLIKLMCSGRINTALALQTFEKGADGVFVAGCLEGECHFIDGTIKARKRTLYAQKLLATVGVDPKRLEMFNLSASMGRRFAEICDEMTERIRQLGPLRAHETGDRALKGA